MGNGLTLNFSKTFEGVVWNIMAMEGKELLILEIRDENKMEATFSAFQYQKQSFLWQDLMLEEPWWVSLYGYSGDILLFQIYDDVQNPEHKSVLAIHAETSKTAWKQKNFSVQGLDKGRIKGMLKGEPEPREVMLDAVTGRVTDENKQNDLTPHKISEPVRPFQYLDGNAYFETIKKFLQQTRNLTPIVGAEYVETEGLVFISYYIMEGTGLANYLLVMDQNGKLLLTEKLGGQLKGLGVETFFILSGCLFFVKNKREFLSFQIK